MQSETWTGLVDRTGWRRGPWDDEPEDKMQWPDETTGLPCLMVRNGSGAWCGYVGVAEDHPLHGVHYGDTYERDVDIDVHGGLTYSGPCSPRGPDGHTICHRPEPGEPDDVWWFGFDTAHSGDLTPGSTRLGWLLDSGICGIYRDAAYVRAEVTSLARQLAAEVSP